MNRRTLPQLLRLVALATFSVFVLTGATGKPIHPPVLGSGGPILIAVVGDHYLAGEEDEFNLDVQNFIKRGLLLDPYYKDHQDDWRFVSYFEPTAAGKESRYGFKIGFGQGNCAVLDDQDPSKTTMQLLNDAVGGDVPRHTIVIGNHRYNFGCSKGDWTYVAVGAVGTDVLQHEFGHRIAYLWDEWVAPTTAPAAPTNLTGAQPPPYYPPTWSANDTRNCWPQGTGAPTPPHWHSPPHVAPPVFSTPFADAKGCNQVANGVIHPYDHCRMGASHMRMFCDVCKAEMDTSFADLIAQAAAYEAAGGSADAARPDSLKLRASHASTGGGFRIMNAAFVREQQPAAPAVIARPVLKVIVRYNPATKAVTIKQMADGNGQYVPNYRRSGQYMFEIKDGAALVDVGIIPDQLFEAHGSRGGAPHVTGKLDEAEFVLLVPGRTLDSLRTRPLKVQFYKIPARVKDRNITKGSYDKVREGGGFETWGEMTLSPPTPTK